MRARAARAPRWCSPPSTSRRPFISMRPARTSCTFRAFTPRWKSRGFSKRDSTAASSLRVMPRSSSWSSGARFWPSLVSVTRILAVADEVDEAVYGDKLDRLRPDLVVSCGDLPFDYLEYIVSRANVPLIYVLGNHDPGLAPADTTWSALGAEPPERGPQGCDSADGRVLDVLGLRIGGLGGSIRYKPGPNQYTQA